MESIPLFPLNTVLFPGGSLPLQIFEVRYLDMINKCIANESQFGVVTLTQGGEVRRPGVAESLAPVGTMAQVAEWHAPMPGLLQVTCIGTTRFQLMASEQLKHGLWMGQVALMENDRDVAIPAELQDTSDALRDLLDALRKEEVPEAGMPVLPPYRLDDCGWVANRWCELLPMRMEQKQLLLGLDNPVLRLELIQDALAAQGLLSP